MGFVSKAIQGFPVYECIYNIIYVSVYTLYQFISVLFVPLFIGICLLVLNFSIRFVGDGIAVEAVVVGVAIVTVNC